MPSDSLLPTPRRRLPKWPFWIGDLLLVGLGLALLLKQGAPMGPLAMASIVFAIAFGAVIACAPYAIEHWLITTKGGGDWAEVRHKLLKLEVRLAEIELNNGAVPESARLAHNRFTEDEEDLGVGEVIKQPKAEQPVEEPKPQQLDFNGAKGAALVGAAARDEYAQPAETSDEDALDVDAMDEDLPTSLDDIGPAEKREPTHLRKALEQARKERASPAVSRLIRGGKA